MLTKKRIFLRNLTTGQRSVLRHIWQFMHQQLKVSWNSFAKTKPVSHAWKTVGSKSRQKAKLKPNDTLKKMPIQVLQEKLTTPPIVEETERVVSEEETQPNLVPELLDHSPKPRKETDNISTASSDGKMSALIPNLNVPPVNDGTIQITLRWKASVEVSHLTESSLQMTASIYALLNELFSDKDGLTYKWDDEGMENFNSFSKMSPEEVQSFIFPSITIMPTQSLVIIPLRFGFTGKISLNWRNQNRTNTALNRSKVTVGFSNSKSTSGKLVVAGYILLKAPQTTHQLRYLQSLRSKLPDTTPGFDILFYRRSPMEQDINHLVVQCGKNHVHPLSQALLTLLDGSGAGVYIPRFAFAKMSHEQAIKLLNTTTHTSKHLSLYPSPQ